MTPSRPPFSPRGDPSAGEDTAEPLEIVLPDPSLVILCGPSGAGKTTFAQARFRPTQVISSDRCRALISDTEEFGPESSGRAFALLYETIRHRLALRRLTVADTTALERSSRARFITLAREFQVPAVLILLLVGEDECFRRNTQRQRDVGRRIIARQHRLLRTAMLSVASEGFDAVHIVSEDMLPRLVIRSAGESLEAEEVAVGAETREPARTVPFEGWIDPWDVVGGGDVNKESSGSVGVSGEVAAVCREIVETVGAVSPERRRSVLATLRELEADPRWVVAPAALPAPLPSEWASIFIPSARGRAQGAKTGIREEENPVDIFGRLCRFLRDQGYRKVCLEAWPLMAEPVLVVAAREPYHALRRLGVEGWGAVVTAERGPLLESQVAAPWMEQIARDLDTAAVFARNRTPLFVAQALAVWARGGVDGATTPARPNPAAGLRPEAAPSLAPDPGVPHPVGLVPDEDPELMLDPAYFPEPGEGRKGLVRPFRPRIADPSRLRLWLTDLLIPAEPSDPQDVEYLWAVTEMAALAEAFGRPPCLHLDLEREDPWENLKTLWWWVGWWNRPGWQVVLTRASRKAGRGDDKASASGKGSKKRLKRGSGEVAEIGTVCPPVRLSGEAGRLAVDGQASTSIFTCRKRAVDAVAAGLSERLWRPWMVAGWALTPTVRPSPQTDLFGG